MIKSILGFDYGLSRIGVAVGNYEFKTASNLKIIDAINGNPDWYQVDKIIKDWYPDLILVGYPLNMDGTESKMSNKSRDFAELLKSRYQIDYVLVDERLSSFSTESDIKTSFFSINKKTRKGDRTKLKINRIDSLVARDLILKWFNKNEIL